MHIGWLASQAATLPLTQDDNQHITLCISHSHTSQRTGKATVHTPTHFPSTTRKNKNEY